ncbi:MAG: hypothetical protein ACYT04_62300, partial [Nostoc sp.]
MPKTSQFDGVMQQLNALSLAELLAVRARVDTLIEGQSLPLGKSQRRLFRSVNTSITQNTPYRGSYRRNTFISSENIDVDILAVPPTINPITSTTNRFPDWLKLRQNQVAQFLESEAKEDDSLEQVIDLVDEWMA